jgi:hypothetical protein
MPLIMAVVVRADAVLLGLVGPPRNMVAGTLGLQFTGRGCQPGDGGGPSGRFNLMRGCQTRFGCSSPGCSRSPLLSPHIPDLTARDADGEVPAAVRTRVDLVHVVAGQAVAARLAAMRAVYDNGIALRHSGLLSTDLTG